MQRKVLQFAPFVGSDEYQAVGDCFAANWLTEGPKSQEFVERLCALMDAEFAVLAPNGTLAIYLGLRALGIGPGDDVIVPDFTFLGSASAVEMTGATPVFCDINPKTLQVEVEHFERVLTERTRAIMPVHIYGMTCDMEPILAFARQRDLLVIEDAAQAVGVRYNGTHAGTFGEIGCFSFFADKTITTGEGGLVVARNEEHYRRLRLLRNQGRLDRGSFIHPEVGYNFRMTDLQAAIGLVQLKKLPQIVEMKNAILTRYRERLREITQVRWVEITPHSSFIPFRIAIFAERAQELMKWMESRGIQSRTFFYPLHRQPAFRYLLDNPERAKGMGDDCFAGAIQAYEQGVCLPSFASLAREDLDYVCDTIAGFYSASP